MNKENILGIDVSTLDYDSLVNAINEKIKSNEKMKIIAVNPEKIIMAQKDSSLKELINSSTYQIPDGIGVVLASKLSKGNIQTRVTGIGMMEKLLELANKEEYNIFLYGAKEEVVKEAKEKISETYPDLKITGYINGYCKDNNKIIDEINKSNAQILFVALGSPRQELWIRENAERLNVNVFQGVGGSFDVFSGRVKRAPVIFQKTGLEWFYRLLSQPSRAKRQLALPRFLYEVIKNKTT
ncbi:WecB/TagA/CpsF family glycosyltransferase [Robertmurraya kyonggiensis]|uniref:N-acetylglucosaminyldiphosphoundecaprenol N-acetyl-beta-D-mannosaminyltransferase n=2 Tax=Robertmurraya kyonggiensis TaxID=1037680 RepID=A0A4U1D476_9BACI|nr:WecB/TagA/CpsF family glycosyltransferase [Robertmurraya kyonggiensis]